MKADIIPLIVGLLVFLASLISLKAGISVAVIEIILGVTAGNIGLQTEEWMLYFAGFGGIVLTFLAGAEVDVRLMKDKFKESFLIGLFSFLIPFLSIFLYTFYSAGWSLHASLIAGTTLSETSVAVVYSALVETNLSQTEIGKFIMASTFITNTGTAIALSILFNKPTLYTLLFVVISVMALFVAAKFSHYIFDHPRIKNRVIEPEIKYIFLLLLLLVYFANVGSGHAILPAFIMGLLMSQNFSESSETRVVKRRLRTVAFAVITPIFFIVVGMKVSLPLVLSAIGLFIALFVIKQLAKFSGVYFLAKMYIPQGHIYSTLLMSTGLTFGLIASIFGLQAGYIDNVQYSVLTGVLIASAVIPTFIAQKWFMPVHAEDLVDLGR